MKSGLSLFCTSAALVCVIALAGCGEAPPDAPAPSVGPGSPPAGMTQPSDSAEEPESINLLDELKTANYTKWTPAPGNETRVAAKGPHGDEVQILLDPTAEEGLASGAAEWPLGAIIAKDIFRDGELVQIAAMKKTADGWYWGEWDAQGRPIAQGVGAEPCEGCHASGTDATLGVVLK